MGVIWTPGQRTTQPGGSGIGGSRELADLALVSMTPQGRIVDAYGRRFVDNGTPGFTAGGATFNGSSSSTYIEIPSVLLREWTLFALLQSSSSALDVRAIALGSSTSTSPIVSIGSGTSNGSRIRGWWRNDAFASPTTTDSAASAFTGAKVFVALSFNDPTLSIYINGVLDTVVTGTAPNAFTLDRFSVGALQRSSASSFWAGGVFVAGAHSKAWDSATHREVASNPWQLFEPDNDPVFYSLAGGANTTGTLSSTLDAATLTGVGAVTRSGTLAVTLDAATLVGIGGVATSGTLAGTLDTATLTGVGALTTSGTLAVTLDDATLAGVGSVAVGTNRDGTLAVTLDAATLSGIGAVTRSGTLAVTLDAATLAGIGTAGQAITGTLAVTLDNATLSGVGAIPAAPSTGGGKTAGKNLSRKQKKKLKAVESQEWLKAEETARQLLSDRFTKQTPQEKAQALETYIESLQPVIEALKALTSQIEEVVEEAPVIELTPHQEVIQRFDRLEKKVKSVEELIIILMADL